MPGRNQFSGIFRGKKAVKDLLNRLVEFTAGEIKILEVCDVLASDKYCVNVVRAQFGRPGKKEILKVRRFVVFRIHDNKIAEYWIFDEDQIADDDFFG